MYPDVVLVGEATRSGDITLAVPPFDARHSPSLGGADRRPAHSTVHPIRCTVLEHSARWRRGLLDETTCFEGVLVGSRGAAGHDGGMRRGSVVRSWATQAGRSRIGNAGNRHPGAHPADTVSCPGPCAPTGWVGTGIRCVRVQAGSSRPRILVSRSRSPGTRPDGGSRRETGRACWVWTDLVSTVRVSRSVSVTAPTCLVNGGPVDCFTTPEQKSPLVANLPAGAVSAVDLLIFWQPHRTRRTTPWPKLSGGRPRSGRVGREGQTLRPYWRVRPRWRTRRHPHRK
jgi:hypothetical protein